MVFWLASWAVCAAVWMLLVDTPYPPELAAGAVVAALAATVVELVRRQRVAMVRVRPRWLRHAWRPVVRVPLDLVVLTRTAVVQLVRPRARHGRFFAVPFAGERRDPEDNARRALAEALGSFAPNTIVVGVDVERGLMLVHQLVPRPSAETIDPLELR